MFEIYNEQWQLQEKLKHLDIPSVFFTLIPSLQVIPTDTKQNLPNVFGSALFHE
jgi:hypothetical protein